MDFPEIFTLKQMLLDAHAAIDDLKGVMQYFFANIGNKTAFLAAGLSVTNKEVDAMLEGVAKRLFDQDIDMAGTPLVLLDDYHFIHGPFVMNGKNGTVIFFTDVGRGLIAVAWSNTVMKYTPFTVGGPFAGGAATGLTAYKRNFNNRGS